MNNILKFQVALRCILFVATTVVLAFLAENKMWVLFFVSAAVALAVFIFLEIWELKPLQDRIRELEEKEARLASKANKSGLLDFFNMRDGNDKAERNEVNGHVLARGSTISLLCETGHSYLDPNVDRHWPELEKHLEQNGTVRLLLIHPNCDAKKFRNEHGVAKNVDIHRVEQLSRKYASLEVRFTTQVYCSIFIADGELIYDPYHLYRFSGNANKESHLLAFHLKRLAGDNPNCCYRALKSHFDILWDGGTTLNSFHNGANASS